MINEKKVITIIGAGNVGTAMTAILSQNKELRVIVYSSKKEQWCKELKYRVMDIDKWNVIEGYEVTDNLEYAVINSNQIFITLPSFMRPDMIKKISAYAQPNTLIAFVPGCGGIEYFCRNLIENGCEIIGFDRVPAVSRLVKYGESVEYDKKKSLKIAGLNVGYDRLLNICDMLKDELGIDFKSIKNYLSITLTPANPIMHPVRLYSMFKNMNRESEIDHNILFYGEWNDETSEYLFKCDDELQDLCRVIGVEDIKFLREHYESYTPKAMTEKMHSILSFKKVQSPLIPMDNGCYKIDFNSRYFVEDFPYGLFIIKGLADICDVVTPMVDEIIRWYLTITNQSGEYRNIPFENGIKTIEDIHSLYRMN